MAKNVLDIVYDWYCPNCNVRDTTREPRPHTRFHACAKMGGFSAPMVQVGVQCKVIAIEREDYIGNDMVQLNDQGRPIMSVKTLRPDGSSDAIVFAPTAVLRS